MLRELRVALVTLTPTFVPAAAAVRDAAVPMTDDALAGQVVTTLALARPRA